MQTLKLENTVIDRKKHTTLNFNLKHLFPYIATPGLEDNRLGFPKIYSKKFNHVMTSLWRHQNRHL